MAGKPTELLATCPSCGYEHEPHSNMDDDAGPTPGDISICWNCTMISEYGPTLGLELVTPKRYDELMLDERLRRLVAVVRAAKLGLQFDE